MTYASEIIEKIQDSENWPGFSNSDFLNDLNEIADQAFHKGTIEGYLASLLIYHQISEELLKLLLECCDFFVQLSVFPSEIQFRRRNDLMFGQLLDNLEKTVSFEKKEDFIKKCRELNTVRINLVHKLTRHLSIQDIEKQSMTVKNIFDEVFGTFAKSYDWFRVTFHGMQKDIDWDDWV